MNGKQAREKKEELTGNLAGGGGREKGRGGGAVNQVVRFSGGRVIFFRVSSKPIVLTKGETHTHFGACIPPPPIPPLPPPPPTPAAFAPAEADAFRTSRYCISAAAALEYESDLPRGGGCGERGGWVVEVDEVPRGVSVERVR